jgi:hypothetical protein
MLELFGDHGVPSANQSAKTVWCPGEFAGNGWLLVQRRNRCSWRLSFWGYVDEFLGSGFSLIDRGNSNILVRFMNILRGGREGTRDGTSQMLLDICIS